MPTAKNSKNVQKTTNITGFEVVNLNLSEIEIPKIRENQTKDLVTFGDDNLFPVKLLNAFNISPTHNAIIQQKARLIAGERIEYNELDLQPAEVDKVKAFINQPSDEYSDTLQAMLKKVSLDYQIFGAYSLEIIYYNDGTIKNVNHLNVSNLRFKPELNGIPKSVWYSSDWSKQRKYNFQAFEIPLFNPLTAKRDKKQIYYYGTYNPQINYYGIPSYFTEGGLNAMFLEGRLMEFHLASVDNGFNPTLHINFFGEIPAKDEQLKRSEQMSRKFKGSKNAGKVIISYAESPETAVKIEPISQSGELHKVFDQLSNTIADKILTAHNLTSPMLLGIKTPGQLGGQNELTISWETFFNSVIKPERNQLKDTLNTLIKLIVPNAIMSIESDALIAEDFSEKILAAVMTVNEIRAQIGLPAIETPTGETPPDNTLDKAIA